MRIEKPYKNPTSLFSTTPYKTVHFIGIGGIGISALAQWFSAQNWAVSGSDIVPGEILRSLQKLGIKVKIGHKKANIPNQCGLVVYTRAIRPENIELREARKRGIPVLSYPEATGALTRSRETIAVAGMHGKSTTTALVSMILVKAGFDPTVIIGTKLKEFGGAPAGRNFRNGKGSYLVLEADEYGGAFLNYSPLVSIVTNIDREHLDFYKNLGNIKKSFLAFFKKTRRGGALVLNKDDKILFSLKPAIETIAQKNNLKIIWYSLYSERNRTVKNPCAKKIAAVIKIPGEHNISNALAALRAGMFLGVSQKTALAAIGAYRGSWRRMEYRGELRIKKREVSTHKKFLLHDSCFLIHVYDDYAHHPTEIKATLRAFREKFPRPETGRAYLICVFQPHQAERLKALFREFQRAFDDADITLVLPIYRVAGRDRIDSRFNSEKLVRAIQKKQPKKLVFYLANPKNLKNALEMLIRNSYHSYKFADSHYVLVMMGAGDIVNYTDLLMKN